MIISRLMQTCLISSGTIKLSKVRSFHSMKNNKTWRRFGIGVGGTVSACYYAKSKIEALNRNLTIDLYLHSHKGEPLGNFSVIGDKYKASFSYNSDLSDKIASSKGLVEQKPMLQSVLEPFDLSGFDSFLSIPLCIFLFLSIIIEIMIIYAFFYRVYSFGLKGTLEWLDFYIDKAIKTPVTFMHILFSIFLWGSITLTTSTINTNGDSMDLLFEGIMTNKDDIIKISEILVKMSGN